MDAQGSTGGQPGRAPQTPHKETASNFKKLSVTNTNRTGIPQSRQVSRSSLTLSGFHGQPVPKPPAREMFFKWNCLRRKTQKNVCSNSSCYRWSQISCWLSLSKQKHKAFRCDNSCALVHSLRYDPSSTIGLFMISYLFIFLIRFYLYIFCFHLNLN